MNDPRLNRETMRRIATACHNQLMPMEALVRVLGDDANVQLHVSYMLRMDWLCRHERSVEQKTGAQFTLISFSTTPVGRLEFGLE